MIKKIIKTFITTMLFSLLFSINLFAAVDMPTIDFWQNSIAYTADKVVITECIAYDINSENSDKVVELNSKGKEINRMNIESLKGNTQNNNTEVWIEFNAEVPEDYVENINIQLIDDYGNTYDFICYKINDYVLNAKLPSGHYITNYCMAYHDYKSEYPFIFPEEFTAEDNGTAFAYELKALWNNESETAIIAKGDNVVESTVEEIAEETNVKTINIFTIIGIAIMSIFVIGLIVICVVLIYLKKRGE